MAPVLALIGFVGLCLLVGAAGGSITADAVRTWYPTLTAPVGKPPNWVFAPVWTALYVMMGVSAWLVWRRQGGGRALRLWGWQLAANAVWTPAFFGLQSPRIAFGVIVVLLVLLGLTVRAFAAIDRRAAWLLLPYLGWTLFATYLNAGFWWLNPV
ncbi:MAG: TspO/MBR family protein [Acetobacteraceae bacterium]